MENIKNKITIRAMAFWGISALVLGGMVFGMVKFASRNSLSDKTPLSLTAPMTEGDWIRGDKNAKVIITEYSDFQCPACGAYYGVVKQLHKDFGDKLAIVYKHFPLRQRHANAEAAALSAEAAGGQGKFWEMHDMLFENQKDWETAGNAREIFIGYAKELGLNSERFKQDLNSKELEQKIEIDYQSGVKAGVNHTPTFFLNGKEIQNPRSYEEFRNIVDEAESKKSQSSS
ncbi:MAG: DsbA family protein [Patescibacteria group bacterium]|nr:DsbA family protein [Patescibacteria group bacterium]MDE1988589.1 DsbA family protein [Patescibacteria group bacterium]MDE2217953.1 DsbA family protein [Patescibacteria group bacterium]